MIGICSIAILFDSSTAYWTTRRVIRGVDGRGFAREVREVTVKRPLIGFEDKKIRLESPDGVWLDGCLYEEAMINV